LKEVNKIKIKKPYQRAVIKKKSIEIENLSVNHLLTNKETILVT